MVLESPERKEYSHAIRLNFNASEDDMDYEALLAGIAASVGRRMKDLHTFVSSRILVDQVKGNRVPRIKGSKRYREEVMDATAPFYRYQDETFGRNFRQTSGRNKKDVKESNIRKGKSHLGISQWEQLRVRWMDNHTSIVGLPLSSEQQTKFSGITTRPSLMSGTYKKVKNKKKISTPQDQAPEGAAAASPASTGAITGTSREFGGA
ncbi:hypothetical protein Tco_0497700 [Tanacetum coccineum]